MRVRIQLAGGKSGGTDREMSDNCEDCAGGTGQEGGTKSNGLKVSGNYACGQAQTGNNEGLA